MSPQLPNIAKQLLDERNLVTVATLNPDGSPQASLLWATYEGDDLLLSTLKERAKHRNWIKDPRTSIVIHDAANPFRYVEVRGSVTISEENGLELIERLSQIYTGGTYKYGAGTRVVARLSPEHVVVHE